MDRIIEALSPLERTIIPFLKGSVAEIIEKTGLDKTSVLRGLSFLENKGLLQLQQHTQSLIELGVNGIYYKKNHLPERVLLTAIEQNNHVAIQDARKLTKLSENEFRVSLGVLKKKGLIALNNGKISLNASKGELAKKFAEEMLLEKLPVEKEKLNADELKTLADLMKRKEIVELQEQKETTFTLTKIGTGLAGKTIKTELIEEVTPELIKSFANAKSKRFRTYDIRAPVPQIHGGKKHFVNQSIEYAKRIWTDLGFTEMNSTLTQTSFWNFDALFQPQDHPTRDMHDTFFIEGVTGTLPKNKKLVRQVKQVHERGVAGSKGWQYDWDEDTAKEVVLRTHTTPLSVRTLASLKKEDLPVKYFSVGKCFRNETLDWSHGFEFYQTDGIVVDKNATFRHLLGYLKIFFTKMGFEKIRFTPAYFPYTEPSVEISAYHPERKVWLELGGAGMFRPEVVIPLLGENIPVLAWGPGFDRIIMDVYKIRDLREMYANNITTLREKQVWTK